MFESTAHQMAYLDNADLETKVNYLFDRAQIIDVIQRYGQGVDTHDFALLRTCYTDEIEVDHSPTIGIGRMRMSADRWCELAEKFHTQLDGDQHVLVPQSIVINENKATCHVLMHAHHFYRQANGSPFQSLVGMYDLSLVKTVSGWKICESVQAVSWAEGNWQFHNDIKDSLNAE